MKATAPDPLAPLIGREHERAWVRQAVQRQDVSLITLSGPGGVGKTRLARALTTELAPRFPDGAYFISLVDLHNPAFVFPAIADAIAPHYRNTSPTPEGVRAALSSARLLLTLDGLERITDVLPELVQLLATCSGVVILATNRSPLGVMSEHLLPVRGLPVPDLAKRPGLAKLARNEAVRLLVQQVQVTDPGFALTKANAVEVARISALLEGLPLALELAGGRLSELSPAGVLDQLAARLGASTRSEQRLPERQQTLRAAIAWTDDLLSSVGRTVLRQLSVFASGFDAEAAYAACSAAESGASTWAVLDAMTELLNYGILRREIVTGEPRYMLPTMIREFALDSLEASGTLEAARRQHATYFLDLAEDASPALIGPDQVAWMWRLDSERVNLRAALRWSLVHDPEMALRLASSLWRFWYARGDLREGQHWLDRALTASTDERSVPRVRALNGLGVLVWAAGNHARALELQRASLSMARELGDTWGMAAAEGDCAVVEYMQDGDAARARAATEGVLDQFRALGDRYSEAVALTALGNFTLELEDLDGATGLFQQALAIAQESGDSRNQVICLGNLAQAAQMSGDFDQGASLYKESLRLAYRLGAQEDILFCLVGMGSLAVARKQLQLGARLLGATATLVEVLGAPLQPAEQDQFDRDVAAARDGLSEEAFTTAWTVGRSQPTDDMIAEILGDAGMLGPADPSRGLSDRQLEVLRLVARGMSDREIAAELFISPATATTHVKHIRTKLDVRSRTAATTVAIEHGFV